MSCGRSANMVPAAVKGYSIRYLQQQCVCGGGGRGEGRREGGEESRVEWQAPGGQADRQHASVPRTYRECVLKSTRKTGVCVCMCVCVHV